MLTSTPAKSSGLFHTGFMLPTRLDKSVLLVYFGL